jgi:transposase
VIAIEGLRVKNMARKHKLAKSVGGAPWSEFARRPESKRERYGKQLARVDSFIQQASFAAGVAIRTARQRI